MDSPNPSEMHIKVFIPAPTFYLQSKKKFSLNGEKEKNNSLVRNVKLNQVKYNKNTKCMTLKKWIETKNIKNHRPRVHYTNNNNGSIVFTLWK